MPRIRIALAAGVVVALVAALVGYLATRPDTDRVPATKKALAAVAVDVLDIEPSSYEVNPTYDVPEPLGVVVRWRPDEGDSHRLHLRVEPERGERWRCPTEGYECDTWLVTGGEIRFAWQDGHPEEDPGVLNVAYVTAGEERSVSYSGELLDGDPRENRALPVSIEQLVELVTDDRFASTTTEEMTGADLRKWPKADDLGDEVATTPRVVAQWMLEQAMPSEPRRGVPFSPERYGEDAVGAELRYGSWRASVVIVPDEPAVRPTCDRGWHCRRSYNRLDGWWVTTGWRPGRVVVILDLEGRDVVGTVTSPGFDRYPRPAWRYGDPGWAVAGLERSYAHWGLTTTKAVADTAAPAWFAD